jgi:hypothetical protein
MLPLGLVNLVALAALYELRRLGDPYEESWLWGLAVIGGSWLVAVLAWAGTSLINPRVADNRPEVPLTAGPVDG